MCNAKNGAPGLSIALVLSVAATPGCRRYFYDELNPSRDAGSEDGAVPDKAGQGGAGSGGTPNTGGSSGAGYTGGAEAAANPCTASRRIQITADQVIGGPHLDFVVLVALTDNWLRSAANGGSVADARAADVRFTSTADGGTPLDHEIEEYDAAAGNLVAWVRVPSLTASTELYLQSGACGSATPQPSAASVWRHYVAVWHLGDDSDATAQANTLTTEGPVTSVAAKIAGGRQFDGAEGALSAGSADSLDDVFQAGGFVSAWIKPNGLGEGNSGRVLSKAQPSTPTDAGWTLAIDPNASGSVILRYSFGGRVGNWSAASNATPFGAWHLVVLQYRGSPAQQGPEFFVDGKGSSGSSQNVSGNPDSDATSSLRIGNVADGVRTFDGQIDEVRMAREVHDPDWYATEYTNQSNPAGFCTLTTL